MSEFAAAAVLVGKDKLSKPWNKALKSAERQAGRSFSKMERAGLRTTRAIAKGFRAVGRGVGGAARATRMAAGGMRRMAVATGGVVAVGAAAVDKFGKYELAVSRLGNVLGTKGRDVVEEYGESLRGLAVELGIAPLEAAEGAYQALSGGVERNKDALIGFLRAAGQASAAGGTTLATSVKAATGVMEVFGDEVGDVNTIFNKLFVTEREGVTTFGDLAANIGDLSSFAREMGVSFDEILAPIASLTKTGLSTSQAFTQLGAIITGVTNATGKQKKAFKKLKIPFGADAIEKAGGLVKLMEKIAKAGEKDKGVLQKLFGRKEAIKGAARLAKSGMESLKTTMTGLTNDTTVFQDNFENVQKRTGFRIQQMKAGFSGLADSLGGGLAEGLGLAETSTDRLGVSFASAGKAVKSGARNFATGFIKALIPGEKLADIDWNKIASQAGTGFGKFVTVLGRVGAGVISIVDALSSAATILHDLATGDNPADRAQRRTGATGTIVDPIEAAIERQEAADLKKTVLSGNALELGLSAAGLSSDSPELAELKNLRDLRGSLGQEQFDKVARLTGRGQFAGSATDAAEGRAFGRKSAAQRNRQLNQGTLAGAFAQAGGVDVGGEVKIVIEDKTKNSTITSSATSKNPKVPIKPAKTGKRKVAGD